jgi:hypothetical protein
MAGSSMYPFILTLNGTTTFSTVGFNINYTTEATAANFTGYQSTIVVSNGVGSSTQIGSLVNITDKGGTASPTGNTLYGGEVTTLLENTNSPGTENSYGYSVSQTTSIFPTNDVLYNFYSTWKLSNSTDRAYGFYFSPSQSTTTNNDPIRNQIGIYLKDDVKGTDANFNRWALYNASTNTTSGKILLAMPNVPIYVGSPTNTGWNMANTNGQVQMNGNVYVNGTNSANYFAGNGSGLTNSIGSPVASISDIINPTNAFIQTQGGGGNGNTLTNPTLAGSPIVVALSTNSINTPTNGSGFCLGGSANHLATITNVHGCYTLELATNYFKNIYSWLGINVYTNANQAYIVNFFNVGFNNIYWESNVLWNIYTNGTLLYQSPDGTNWATIFSGGGTAPTNISSSITYYSTNITFTNSFPIQPMPLSTNVVTYGISTTNAVTTNIVRLTPPYNYNFTAGAWLRFDNTPCGAIAESAYVSWTENGLGYTNSLKIDGFAASANAIGHHGFIPNAPAQADAGTPITVSIVVDQSGCGGVNNIWYDCDGFITGY